MPGPWEKYQSEPQGGFGIQIAPAAPKTPTPQNPEQRQGTVLNNEGQGIRNRVDAATSDADIRKARADAEKAELETQRLRRLVADPTGALGVEQSKASGFYDRAVKANGRYEGLGVGAEPLTLGIGELLLPEKLEGYIKTDKRKSADANIEGFISAVLRYESGANIPDQEFESAYRMYFPKPGDGPETLAEKAKLRADAINALRLGSGQGASVADQQREKKVPFDPNGEGSIGFMAPKGTDALPPGAQEWQRAVTQGIAAGKINSGADIAALAKQYGFPVTPELLSGWDKAVKNIRSGAPFSVGTPDYEKPDISDARTGKGFGEKVDAFGRGAADVMSFGLADKGAALIDTMLKGGSYRENLRRQYAISDYDFENHFPSRLGGQVVGGFGLPMGEMRTLGQVVGKGAGMGAGYGAGSSRSWEDVPANAFQGGATGGFVGGTLYGATRGGRSLIDRMLPTNPNEIPPLFDATGRMNEPLQSARPSQRMAAAKEFGIDLPLDAAGDRGAAIFGKGLDNMPLSAGVMNDARRVTEGQVTDAVNTMAGRYGNATGPYAGGQAGQRAAKNWLGRFDNVSEKAYNAIPIAPRSNAITGSTTTTLQQLTGAFQSNPKLAEAFRNTRLETYLDALKNGRLSWEDLKAFRSRIGYEIGEQRFSDSPTKDQLRALYGALSEDMRATAAATGPKALRAFERANTIYAKGQERIENALTAILGDNGKMNPEAAVQVIQKIASSGRGSPNIEQLRQIRASMMKGDEWGEVASSLINLMGQPAKSEGRAFDPAVFIRSYADMTNESRGLLFGGPGRGELKSALDRFVAVNQRLAGTNALRNTSQTAPNAFGGAAVGTLSGTTVAGLTNPGYLAGLLGWGATNYGMAKLWTNPRFVNWATGYSRAAASGNPNAARTELGRLKQLAIKNPGIREEVGQFMRQMMASANDNAGQVTRSAASPGNDEEQRQDNRGY